MALPTIACGRILLAGMTCLGLALFPASAQEPSPSTTTTAPAPQDQSTAPVPQGAVPPAASPADPAIQPAPPSPAEQGTSTPAGSTPNDTATAPTAATPPSPLAAAAARAPVEPLPVGPDWPHYGGSTTASRYSPLDQITPDNVGQLQKVWTYRTGDMPSEAAENKYAPETTPLKIGDRLYLCSAKNILIAVNAASGEEIWRYDPQVADEAIPYSASCRGVSYYAVPDAAPDSACATRIIEGTLDARLIAVDARTGEPCANFGDNGAVDLWTGIGEKVPGWYAVTAPPAIVRGVVVTGAQVKDGEAEDAPSGVIRGYDAVTGALVWAWDLANPAFTGLPPEGQTYTRGTPNMWTAAVGDEALGYVYLPLGNSSVDYFGGNRSEAENEWSTSLVALDVTTGKPVWHFQTVRYDVWDYDLGSQPTLVDFPRDGGTVPAVVLPSKQGDIYILDRRTGESLFPVNEEAAPAGGVENEALADSQPTSAYHDLRFPRLTEKDMWGMTPLDQLWCRIQFRRAAYDGPYTAPTSDRYYIEYPGYNGGSDWGSVAVDPSRGILIANYNNMPNHNRLLTREEADERGLAPIYERNDQSDVEGRAEGAGDPQTGAPYAIDVNAGWRVPFTGLLCKEPPYGGIRAIELATGKTLWDEPIGTARKNGPFGIPTFLPITIGTPNNGGPLVTAGGLVFIAAATDDLIRAIDIKTGKVVWQDELPAGGQATPMAYEVDGRQYIGFMAGGHHFMETPIGDYVIAYALPQ
ncbi:pyrroloquinoline quinone-dependent dehydrogenase [Mangrovicella endophytica]|uniref:pyrroloquinoline quinone-dependent dehydrogenase n=1 Tax=Mangrovicella endophytica TaxID=2066697 RepID=UPI001FDEBA5B|nr:pyrroloquinoline quinone-dependent dehydrogenase [Mangrovicella endophytica]